MLDVFPVGDFQDFVHQFQPKMFDDNIPEPSVPEEESRTSDENLVVSSLQELQSNVQTIMSSLKLKDENPGKKKRVTMTILLQAVQNIYHILRINGFAVPQDMLNEE